MKILSCAMACAILVSNGRAERIADDWRTTNHTSGCSTGSNVGIGFFGDTDSNGNIERGFLHVNLQDNLDFTSATTGGGLLEPYYVGGRWNGPDDYEVIASLRMFDWTTANGSLVATQDSFTLRLDTAGDGGSHDGCVVTAYRDEPVHSVPEPSTAILLAIGVLFLRKVVR